MNEDIVIEYLKQTWLGVTREKGLSGNEVYKYNWLQFIGPSIKSFLHKFEEYVNGNETELLFVQEIDSLCLKFEGIIRDLISLRNIDEFRTFYFDRNGNFKWQNINKYLNDSNIFKILRPNEVYFLRYLLIDFKNLRNKVAHSLNFLGEYGLDNMILLFIAILRISKCIVLEESKE